MLNVRGSLQRVLSVSYGINTRVGVVLENHRATRSMQASNTVREYQIIGVSIRKANADRPSDPVGSVGLW
jgi:hypothetical protein